MSTAPNQPRTSPPTARYIRVPARGVEDIRALLADPELHWKEDGSAYKLAHCWWEADQFHRGLPPSIRTVFRQSSYFILWDLQPLIICPELKTPLPGGRRASQTDMWVLASPPYSDWIDPADDVDPDTVPLDPKTGYALIGDRELVSIAVEGKCEESFGPTLGDWLVNASPGKQSRLAFLCMCLGLDANTLPPTTRYQLLHRTSVALIEAKRHSAKHAVMLVQSFSPVDTGFADYGAFVTLFGQTAAVNQVVHVGERHGVQLYLGWMRGCSGNGAQSPTAVKS